MKQVKSVYIIPGFGHKPTRKEYHQIAELFRKSSYHPILVNVNWQRSIISQNSADVLKKIPNEKSKQIYLFGFSFGAVIAYLISTKIPIKGQVLCSLSPYFKEDLKFTKKSKLKFIGKRRCEDFRSISNDVLAKNIKTKTILLYGTNENSELVKRVKDTYQKILSTKKLVPVLGAKHDIADQKYLEEIKKAIAYLD